MIHQTIRKKTEQVNLTITQQVADRQDRVYRPCQDLDPIAIGTRIIFSGFFFIHTLIG